MDLSSTAPLLYKYWPVAAAISAVVVAHKIWQYLRSQHTVMDLKRKKSVSFSEKIETLPTTSKYAVEDDDVRLDTDNFFTNNEELPHVSYNPPIYPEEEMKERAVEFYKCMNSRRSCRFFSDKPVPMEIIESIVKTAGTSPSGAHTEPWMFVVVSDADVKRQIREIVEEEEEINYRKRMGSQWLQDIERLATSWRKPYLETAPYIVVVFKQVHGFTLDGTRKTHYYSEISVSIAVGLFIAAVQYAGLVTLTSTPMNAGAKLRHLLGRPINEKVAVLLPVGYPAEDATVPNFSRKPLDEIMVTV